MSKNRTDYEYNHAVIRTAYIDLIGRLKRKPTLSELAKETRLSIKTIDRHLGSLKFNPSDNTLRVLTDDVLISIFVTAKRGNVAAQKLWLSVFEGWTEKTMLQFDDGTNDIYKYREMTMEELDKEIERLTVKKK